MQEKPLTLEQKQRIWQEIWTNMLEDDRYPNEVIVSSYGGDEERYLRVMGHYHGILKGEE